MSSTDDVIATAAEAMTELTPEQSWGLLVGESFGRLAYRLIEEVHVVPVNYAVEGARLLIRTAAGGKLFGAALGTDAALEIDWHDEGDAWSVVARGRLRRLEEDEVAEADPAVGLPWVSTPKNEIIELLPEEVTGRRFRLHRPGPGRSPGRPHLA
ncbi:pyridoxamine 5'-phosphate oxidase family protein [Nocardioides sp. GXZ039]|uniref:pyridoxamine 5'-phosphate oxidase family protein n=1 Tax=Nocardioides sp. GXZ039 TaxID=3136018 RepID=UPI0030F42F08